MNKSKLLIILTVLALLVVPALAQQDPKAGYTEWQTALQSRNIPAGTVNDPGSHLTYFLDTGVNARDLLGDVSLATATSTPLVDLQSWLDVDQDGQLDSSAIIQNFVAISNTHPTMAVTVHFRYFNDNCDDVLDFLVILTCNDTLLFDPFDFVIPGSNGENTRDRIFGPARPGKVLSPIPTSIYGSGRFILTAAASGASWDNDDQDAEILFPYELGRALDGECNISYDDGWNPADWDFSDIDATLSGYDPNVGTSPGLEEDNLHVFNATQISFNFLIGHQTYAVPYNQVFQAGGINAWARPAIWRGEPGPADAAQSSIGVGYDAGAFGGEVNVSQAEYQGDGDGEFANTGWLVLGGELGWTSVETRNRTPVGTIDGAPIFLRSELHGGDIRSMIGAVSQYGGTSLYGAQGTSPFFPVAPTDIIQHFVSVTDDYNGSNNAGVTGFPDHSSNISAAATTYVLQIYDNNEDILEIIGEPPLNVSPPVPGKTVELKMVCMCLRTFLTTTIAPGTNVDDVTIAEMADVFGNEVLDGLGDFDGLLVPVAPDLSGGWIRYVRDNTNTVSLTAQEAADVGFTVSGNAHGPGTSTFDVTKLADSDIYGPSFMTISNIFTKQAGFGVLWYNFAVPSDAQVSETGDPVP